MCNKKYQFSKSKIIFGDALLKMDLIPDNSVDFICADLPTKKTKNHWDKIIDPDELWKQCWRICKPNAAIVFFGQDKFSAMMMLSSRYHRYNIIYKKTTVNQFLNANRMPLRCHEDMMVFYKRLPVYNPQKTSGHKRKTVTKSHKKQSAKSSNYGNHGLTHYDSDERFPKSVWEYKTDKQKINLNPTQKPVELIKDLIKTFTNEGALVLDLCSGSGTLGVASIETNRDFIIIEKDIKQFKGGLERISEHCKETGVNFDLIQSL